VLKDTTQLQGKGGHLSSGVRVYLFSTLQNPTKIKSGRATFQIAGFTFSIHVRPLFISNRKKL
jgi:hypothetical protein